MNALVLLVTRDTDLIGRMTEPWISDCYAINHIDRLDQADIRVNAQGVILVLAVDLSTAGMQEWEPLRWLMHALPDVSVLALGDDYDPIMQARLMAQGVQDVLLKHSLNRGVLWRAAQSAIARKAREMVMFHVNERARVTLASIGDAVLSTDKNGCITFLNPVAEKLTGWTCVQAIGKHVAEIFQVLDGATRVPITPQIEMAVGTGSTIMLPPDCVLVRHDGHELHIEDSAAPIYDDAGRFAGMVVVFHDASKSRALTQKMSHLAEHDVLTSLPNRVLLIDRLERGIALAKRYTRQLAVLFIDLDHFKHINDSLGHAIGDCVRATSPDLRP